MYKKEKNLLLAAVDHGFSTMKTPHYIFENGVEELKGEATLTNNTLVYQNRQYKVGEGRLPIKRTKTEDDCYFLLTLAAIAKEMDFYHQSDVDVILAAGLPFSRFGQEKQEFRDYLLRRGDIEWRYCGKDYHIHMKEVYLFPQCYAAVADRLRQFGPEMLCVDIGSKTVDIIHTNRFVPVERESTSIPEALIFCMETIKSAVYQKCNRRVSEEQIRRMIIKGDTPMPEDCKEMIRIGLQSFAKGMEAKLSELGFDLEMIPVVYAGGGASVMKRYGTLAGNHVVYLEDVRANAKGYEYLARQKCGW
ncbi:MAG: ParM/StbA family protein [Muribaculaceae bacterium]|nr:ParM/StbA family protein [Muribaculaceae bacterium]MCM1560203.1 ParM/StbA family protein [Butyrivibrio sp.]